MELSEAIQYRTESVGKNYHFGESQNPFLPAQHWFQHSTDGLTLFVVFYSQACRWSKCLGCNLPSKMSQYHVSFDKLMKQIDYIFDYVVTEENKSEIRKIIISNNGSILDEDTFSSTALFYFIAKMNMVCPSVQTLCIETRPEYVDMEELEILARVLKEGQTNTHLEIAVGFEAFDDDLRNQVFFKGLTIRSFEELAGKLAQHQFKLKTYFMLKPVPGMTEAEAIEDIEKGVDYLSAIAKKHDIEINMHLNPTYAAFGTPLEQAFKEGTFSPPRLESIQQILLFARDKGLSIFVGLYDEGLAVPGGSCVSDPKHKLVSLIEQFNESQDYDLLV